MARYSDFGLYSVALLALSFAAPASAQGELVVETGKPWTHRHSGITVPATLGGNTLTQARTYAPQELDLSLSFEPDDARDFLSFYIFRNTNGGVPVWMAQAQWSIENRGIFQGATLAVAPQAFTPPGQTNAVGLKTVYATPDASSYKSTGIALLPFGEWYVKLRVTSRDKSPAELAQAMEGWLKEIRWPENPVSIPAALPVTPCQKTLAFGKSSKDAPVDMTNSLATAMISAVAGEGKRKQEQVQWCRDSGLDGSKTVYRPDAAQDSYLLAIGDNGNGVWVAPSVGNVLNPGQGGGPRFDVTLHMAAVDIHFVSQNRLPSPQRAMEIVDAGRAASTVTTWGEKRTIEINDGAKGK
ncbi:hypothetical protein [Sphingopyxis witflariensis]|uniref:hypothetical protein n=1 Tax=Sphingopyxis witflariensis TaxID=173675 RepID=UPI0011819B85|nr:hypothetical protein [Sphingopyxis witflariensis]